MDYVISILPQMWEGTLETIRLFAITIVLSIPLGVLLALGRVSGFKALRDIIGVYVWLLRGTPLMLQLLFVYYGLPFIPGIGVRLDDFPAAVFAFVLNYAAYFCEIFRGGIESIPHGQHEAAATLGFTRSQTFFHIILPQVIKRVLPASGNEVITLVKDTALAQTIGVVELFALAQKQASFKFSIVPLFAAGLMYFVLNWVVTLLFSFAEKKLDYYKR